VPYKVLTGLSYPPDKRAEVGSIVDDIPAKSVKWLLEKGHIESVGATSSAKIASDFKVNIITEPVTKDGEK